PVRARRAGRRGSPPRRPAPPRPAPPRRPAVAIPPGRLVRTSPRPVPGPARHGRAAAVAGRLGPPRHAPRRPVAHGGPGPPRPAAGAPPPAGRPPRGRPRLEGRQWRFLRAGSSDPPPALSQVRLDTAALPPLRAGSVHRVTLRDGQSLTAGLLGLDGKTL